MPMPDQPPPRPPAADGRMDDPQLGEAVAGARRVRWCARLAGLILLVVCAVIGGEYWGTGAFLGWLVVELNLGLLVRTLARAPAWRGRTLWPTLARFYLTFGATVVVCILIIRNNWGHPLAFLLGLLSFFAGLVLALVSWAFKKPGPSK